MMGELALLPLEQGAGEGGEPTPWRWKLGAGEGGEPTPWRWKLGPGCGASGSCLWIDNGCSMMETSAMSLSIWTSSSILTTGTKWGKIAGYYFWA